MTIGVVVTIMSRTLDVLATSLGTAGGLVLARLAARLVNGDWSILWLRRRPV